MQTGSVIAVARIDELEVVEGALDRFTETGIHLRDGRWIDWHVVESVWVLGQ